MIGSDSLVTLRILKSSSNVMLDAVLFLKFSQGSYGIVTFCPANTRRTLCLSSALIHPSFTNPKFSNLAPDNSTLPFAAFKILAGFGSLLFLTFGFKKKSAPLVGLNFSVLSTVIISDSVPVDSFKKLYSLPSTTL